MSSAVPVSVDVSSREVAYLLAMSVSIETSGPRSLRKAAWIDAATAFDEVEDEEVVIGLARMPVICCRRPNFLPDDEVDDAVRLGVFELEVSTSILFFDAL